MLWPSWIAVILTFLLMNWGNLVSATGSGLACPDWPLCYGTIAPPLRDGVVWEWGHRLLAFATTVLVISNLIRLKKFPSVSLRVRNVTRHMVLLLVIQILLGGVTVLLQLSVLVSTVHLVIATFFWSGLILMAMACTPEQSFPSKNQIGVGARQWGELCLFLTLVQFVLGAILRHGQIGLACPNFPNCVDQFLPPPDSSSWLAFVHRWWGFLLFFGLFTFAWKLSQEFPRLTRWALGIIALCSIQILLGILTVLSFIATPLRALHATTGYLLWAMTLYLTIRAGGLPLFWKAPSVPTRGVESKNILGTPLPQS